MARNLDPETAAEYQALAVLASAAELAEEIDRRRHELAGTDALRHRHPAASAGLLEAAERLVNLIALLQRRSQQYAPDFATRMDEQVAVLRRRLLGSTRELVIDRARTIARRASAVLDGSAGYPLGLTGKLRELLSGIEMTVDVLGGPAALSYDDRTALAQAGAALASLSAREAMFDLVEAVA